MKYVVITTLISIVFLLNTGCKKEEISMNEVLPEKNGHMARQSSLDIEEIQLYLLERNALLPDTSETIENILTNMDVSQMQVETMGEENLIIIPVSITPELTRYANTDLEFETVCNLLIVEDENGEIRRADLSLFEPVQEISEIPEGSFTDFSGPRYFLTTVALL